MEYFQGIKYFIKHVYSGHYSWLMASLDECCGLCYVELHN